MSMYVYTCTYLYTRMYTHINIYIHKYIYIHVYSHIHTSYLTCSSFPIRLSCRGQSLRKKQLQPLPQWQLRTSLLNTLSLSCSRAPESFLCRKNQLHPRLVCVQKQNLLWDRQQVCFSFACIGYIFGAQDNPTKSLSNGREHTLCFLYSHYVFWAKCPLVRGWYLQGCCN